MLLIWLSSECEIQLAKLHGHVVLGTETVSTAMHSIEGVYTNHPTLDSKEATDLSAPHYAPLLHLYHTVIHYIVVMPTQFFARWEHVTDRHKFGFPDRVVGQLCPILALRCA
mgnify:CR=1 FL=1